MVARPSLSEGHKFEGLCTTYLVAYLSSEDSSPIPLTAFESCWSFQFLNSRDWNMILKALSHTGHLSLLYRNEISGTIGEETNRRACALDRRELARILREVMNLRS